MKDEDCYQCRENGIQVKDEKNGLFYTIYICWCNGGKRVVALKEGQRELIKKEEGK